MHNLPPRCTFKKMGSIPLAAKIYKTLSSSSNYYKGGMRLFCLLCIVVCLSWLALTLIEHFLTRNVYRIIYYSPLLESITRNCNLKRCSFLCTLYISVHHIDRVIDTMYREIDIYWDGSTTSEKSNNKIWDAMEIRWFLVITSFLNKH